MAIPSNVANHRWAIQTAQGTPAATSVYAAYLAGGSMVGAMGTDADFEETSGIRMRSDRYVSERHAAGAPEFYVMPNAVASLLYGALGAVATTGAADPYTHTITPATSRPWFTFWRSQGALIYEESSDCKIDQLVISGSSGAPLRVTANVIGLRPRHQTAEETTAAVEVANRMLFYDGDGALSLEGAAVASIREFTLTISNNGEIIPGDNLTGIDVSEGQLTVELAITKLFLAASLRNRLYYGGASPSNDAEVVADILTMGGTPSVDFKFTRVAAAPGPERSLSITMPKLTLDPFDLQPSTGNEPLTEALTMHALQPSGDDAIEAIVKNSLSDLTP